MEPTVTIIVPVYNTANYLPDCLSSCMSQDLESIEILCIDDGSLDNSAVVVKEFAQRDERIRLFGQSHLGAAAARNLGLQKARGKYVSFMDSDDYYPTNQALRLLVEALRDSSVLVSGGSMCMDRDGVLDFDSLHGRELDSFSRAEVVEYRDYQYDYDYTRYIYSREMLVKANIHFPPYLIFEDPPFFIRIMLEAGRFCTIPDSVYCYRHSLHDAKCWSVQQASDRLRGIIDCLKISHDRGYATLHRHVALQLAHEAPDSYVAHAENAELLSLLCRANSLVDTELIRREYPDFPEYFVADSLRVLSGYSQLAKQVDMVADEILLSTTYKVGKALMTLPCAVKDRLHEWKTS